LDATGSATGPLGAYLVEYGLLPKRDGERFVNERGVKMKRRSSILPVIEAAITLP
jgi:predicted PhzF superfamily epimerase YddE/YHI9